MVYKVFSIVSRRSYILLLLLRQEHLLMLFDLCVSMKKPSQQHRYL